MIHVSVSKRLERGHRPCLQDLARAGVLLAFVLATPVFAQSELDRLYDDALGSSESRLGDERPWDQWHGPYHDGIHGLHFGMDRYQVARELQSRDLEGRPSRIGTQRFEGKILGEPAEVVTDYSVYPQAASGEVLSRIRLHWTQRGVPNASVALYEKLSEFLTARYGEPLAVEEQGFAALDNGYGSNRRAYVGPEARVILELEAVRKGRYSVILTLESPQLHAGAAGDGS